MSQNLQSKSIIKALEELNNLKLSKQPETTIKNYRHQIIMLIKNNAFLQNEKFNAMTPLMYSIALDEPQIAYFLIKSNASYPEYVNARGESAIIIAFQHIEQPDMDIIISLLLQTGKVNVTTPDRDNNTCLIYACKHKKFEEIALTLLDYGNTNPEHVDNFSNTALMYAINNDTPEVASKIIQTGQSNPSHVNNVGLTALIISIVVSLPNVAIEILNTGNASPEHIDNDQHSTALIYACAKNMSNVALAILNTGESNPDVVDIHEFTALMYAIKNNMEDVIPVLLQTNNSNPTFKNSKGDSAFTIAKINNFDNVVEMLQPYIVETNFIDINQTGFYAATQETLNITDHLNANPDNVCFKVDDKYYLSNKFEILKQITDTSQIKLACIKAGENEVDENNNLVGYNYIASSNIDNSVPYFSMSSIIGLQIVVNAKIMHKIISDNFSTKLFILEPSGIVLPGIMSYAYYNGSYGASADHCQSGKSTPLYNIKPASPICNQTETETNEPANNEMQIDEEPAVTEQTIKVQYKGHIFTLPVTLDTTLGDVQHMLIEKLIQNQDPNINSYNFTFQFIYAGTVYNRKEDQTNKLLTELANPPFGITLQAMVKPMTGGGKRTKKHKNMKKKQTKKYNFNFLKKIKSTKLTKRRKKISKRRNKKGGEAVDEEVFKPETYGELKEAIQRYGMPKKFFNKGPISKWDITNITDLSGLFSNSPDFNENINDWDVSNVTDMSYMFAGCEVFNQPLDKWKVNNVIYMDHMFIGCYRFNQPLDTWNVSNVEDMTQMFMHASFNQDISNWTLKEGVITTDIFTDTPMQQKFKPPNSEPHYKDMITDEIIANNSTAYRDYIDKQYRIYEAKNFELTICDAVFLYLMYFDYYVNEFLRDNPELIGFKNEKLLRFFNKIIDVFDNYFLTQAPKITDESVNKQLNFVYRGEKQLCEGNTCRVGLMPAYTSSSPDVDIGMMFTNNNDCCLYTYELPVGMPYIDVEDIIDNTEKYCNIPPFKNINVTLIEYILPRGIVLSNENIKEGFEDWDFNGTNKRIQSFTKSVSYDPNYIQNNPVDLVAKYISNNNNEEAQEPLTKKQKI